MRATFKLRVFDYLAKPFSLAQFRQTLDNAIEQFGLEQLPRDRLRLVWDTASSCCVSSAIGR